MSNEIDKKWVCNCPSPLSDLMDFKDKQCMVCGMKKKDINTINYQKIKQRMSRVTPKIEKYTNPFKRIDVPLIKVRNCLVCGKKKCKIKQHMYIVNHHSIFDMVNGKVVEVLSRKGVEEVNKLK